jgi:5-methylcytosine-specific restriction enzyme A
MAKWPYCTSRWQKLRAAKLSHDPLCYVCRLRGVLVPANTVDHIRPIRDGGEPFPDLDGLMSLCERCHNEKTNAVDRRDRRGSGRRFKGCDIDGNPIDPGDAWHGGKGVSDRCSSSHHVPASKMGKYLVSTHLPPNTNKEGS